MARKSKKGGRYDPTGKSVDELISAGRNLSRMKEGTIRTIVSRLASAANKRLSRAEKSGSTTPAMEKAKRSGGKFSTAGKGLEALKQEFIRVKDFLRDPTSSIRGWKQVQREANQEAQRKGIFPWGKKKAGKTPAPSPAPPPPPSPTLSDEEKDILGAFGFQGYEPPPVTEDETPDGWTWNEEKRYWEHPKHGGGWLPYEGEGGGFFDPITGEIADNEAREYHDYDSTVNERVFVDVDGKIKTQTGKIWEMVDDLVELDPKFARGLDSGDGTARTRLFNAIDNLWVENPTMTFEQARDRVMLQMQEIYEGSTEYLNAARGGGNEGRDGTSRYFRDRK